MGMLDELVKLIAWFNKEKGRRSHKLKELKAMDLQTGRAMNKNIADGMAKIQTDQ
jgi:hypothetical protein